MKENEGEGSMYATRTWERANKVMHKRVHFGFRDRFLHVTGKICCNRHETSQIQMFDQTTNQVAKSPSILVMNCNTSCMFHHPCP